MHRKAEIRISGHGGQGVILAGQILGKAAVLDGKNALQTQSYGAEARRSLAESEVIISESKIGFPAVRKCDALVAMNQESLDKYWSSLKANGGILIVDSAIERIPETNATILRIPATEIAKKKFGDALFANMIMLGTLVKTTRLVSEKAVEKAIRESVTKETIEFNIKAFRKGLETAVEQAEN